MTTQNKVTVSLNSVRTTLAPLQYGKAEPSRSHRRLEGMVQVFKPSVAEERKFRLMAYMANNGTISVQRLDLLTLSNSVTNNTSMQNRPVFVSTSCDPNEYVAKNKRVVFGDSNSEVIQTFFQPNNPMNSLIVKGSVASMLIPMNNKWDNKEHNAHLLVLMHQLHTIANANTTEVDKLNYFTKAWDKYKAVEEKLVADGLLVENMVLVADTNGVIPNISINQYTHNSKNEYLDAKSRYSNEKSKATFVPILNNFSGVVDFTDSTGDKYTDYTYGMNVLGNKGNNDQSDNTTGYKQYTTEAFAYAFDNTKASSPIRVVVGDGIYGTRNNSKSRSERFEEFKSKHNSGNIHNAQLVLAPRLGGDTYTSTFSLEGNNITYSTYKSEDNNEIVVNLDDEVKSNENAYELSDIGGLDELMSMDSTTDNVATSDSDNPLVEKSIDVEVENF